FYHYGLAKEYPLQQEESTLQIIFYIGIFLFLVVLFIVVTIQLIKRLIKKQIEGFLGPFVLSVIAGFGWFYITSAMGGSLTGISLIEPLIMTYLTFAVLLIRWERSETTFRENVTSLKTSVALG